MGRGEGERVVGATGRSPAAQAGLGPRGIYCTRHRQPGWQNATTMNRRGRGSGNSSHGTKSVGTQRRHVKRNMGAVAHSSPAEHICPYLHSSNAYCASQGDWASVSWLGSGPVCCSEEDLAASLPPEACSVPAPEVAAIRYRYFSPALMSYSRLRMNPSKSGNNVAAVIFIMVSCFIMSN